MAPADVLHNAVIRQTSCETMSVYCEYPRQEHADRPLRAVKAGGCILLLSTKHHGLNNLSSPRRRELHQMGSQPLLRAPNPKGRKTANLAERGTRAAIRHSRPPAPLDPNICIWWVLAAEAGAEWEVDG